MGQLEKGASIAIMICLFCFSVGPQLPSLATRRHRTNPPRPPNQFMLFRKDYVSRNPKSFTGSSHQLDINPDVSTAWQKLDLSGKEIWKKKAEEEKERHKLLYPGYKYHPVRGQKTQKQPRYSRAKPSKKTGCDRTPQHANVHAVTVSIDRMSMSDSTTQESIPPTNTPAEDFGDIWRMSDQEGASEMSGRWQDGNKSVLPYQCTVVTETPHLLVQTAPMDSASVSPSPFD